MKKQVLFILFFLITVKIISQPYVEQTNITLAPIGGYFSWGDCDNDGDLDILSMGYESSTIFLNNNDNTFTGPLDIGISGINGRSYTWGDYDNDGDLDILLTGNTGISPDLIYVSKIYRNNGNNTFAEQTGIALTGVSSGSAAWGDYDNDGNLDILLTGADNSGNAISKIYRNNGDNSFAEQTGISLTGVWYSSVAWGDLDNDGDLDICFSGQSSSGMVSRIYRNNGDNTFTQVSSSLIGVENGSVALGDFDSDGKLDILLTGMSSSGPVSRVYHNSGNLTFLHYSGIALTGVKYSSATWGDFDNDGDLDILLTGMNTANQRISKIYRNNGIYSFTEQTGIALTGVMNGSAVWGDYDNDSDLDILLTGYSSSGITKIYRNEITTPNVKPATPSNLQTAINNGIVTFSWDAPVDTETPRNGLSYNIYLYESGQSNYKCPPHAFKQSDIKNGLRLISRTGNIQLSSTGYSIKDLPYGKTYYWTVQAIDAGFQGSNFNTEQSFTMPFYRPATQASNITFSNINATGATITYDKGGGEKRAVFIKTAITGIADPMDNTTYNVNDITPGGWKCVYNGTGNSVVLTELDNNTGIMVQVCEYNGSPGNENYLSSPAYQNPASLTFIEQKGVSLPGIFSGSAAWGDYDKDGNLDVLLTGSGISKIYHNNGDNSFTEQIDIPLTGVSNSSVALGDYDNDGDLDILLTGSTSSAYISKIYSNNGDNTFTWQTGITLPGVSSGSIAWGDYDNDGDLDILLTGASNSGSISKIYRNNGDNSFDEQTGISLAGIADGSAAWGDYDNDGNLDVLLTGSGISKIYHNNGDNSFTEQTGISIAGVSYSSVAWGDYDNDGDQDILLTGYSGSNYISKIYQNNGNKSFTEQTGISLAGVWNSSVGWGDYDNDGDLDILLTGATSNTSNRDPISIIYLNNGNNSFTESFRNVITGVQYGSTAWGDYDNDGDLDILITGKDNLGNPVSKIYRNELINPNSNPLIPSGLQTCWNNDSLLFKWSKSSDNTTPTRVIGYNLRIGTSPGGIDVKSPQSLPDGQLLLPNINNLVTDTSFTLKLPLNKYYWSVQAIDKSGLASSFAPEQITPMDSIQSFNLQAVIKSSNSMLIRWKNGNGMRRAVFGRISSSSEMAKPINGTLYHAEPYLGEGDKISGTGLYCIYNGKADSAIIYGLNEGYSYDIHVVEYIENAGLPQYFNTIGNGNPGVFSLSLFSEQTGIILPGVMGASVAWGDYDNDGYLDILLTGSSSSGSISKIYRNNGNNTFSEQTGIVLVGIGSGSAAWGDYDNDGNLDILIGPRVYRNNSDNSFTWQSGITLPGNSGAWGDYDNDGDLDILIGSKVFRNNGNNSFTEQIGIALPVVGQSSVAWGDYDNDGDLDILLTGYLSSSGNVSKIYRNEGDNRFTEQTGIALTGVRDGSVSWGDYDNDGDLDILITGSSDLGITSKIYRNNGDNSFSMVRQLPGVDYSSSAWGDYDNDGDLDILLAGLRYTDQYHSGIYRNDGNNSFPFANEIVLTGVQKSSVAWGDYDNDGDLDFLLTGSNISGEKISRIYSNNTIMKAGNYPVNKKPAAPVKLRNTPQPGNIKLSWSPVRSDETSYKTMSYNVRIGTTTGKSNISTAQADSVNGYRRITTMGNSQLDTTFYIKNIPSGKYYWNVQAVDQGYMGGEWSAVDSFMVKNTQAFFKTDIVCHGVTTHFTDQSVAATGIALWKWDFMDGSFSTEQNPAHTFNQSGTYNVKLVITDAGGTKDSLVQTVNVKAKPLVGFNAPAVCTGTPVTVTNTTNVNGLTISGWSWNFGDASTSSAQQPPPHPYLTPAGYNLSLKAVASNGCADSLTKEVMVANYPVAVITTSGPVSFCQGDSVTLSAPLNPAFLYAWKLSGVNLTGGSGNSFKAKTSGLYNVEISNPTGNCVSTSSSVNIVVRQSPSKPVIEAANYTAGQCPGENPVRLSVSPMNGYSYQWKINGIEHQSDTLSYLEFYEKGNFSLTAGLNGCFTESDIFTADFPEGPVKPVIYSEGSSLWYLACSNMEAKSYKWYLNGKLVEEATKYFYVANQKLGIYQVSIEDEKGCFTRSDAITIPPGFTGVDDAGPFSGLKIYPNPTPGLFTIEMDNNLSGELMIDIFSLSGKKVLNIRFEKMTEHFRSQVDLSGQSKGTYVINFLLNKYFASKKIMIK